MTNYNFCKLCNDMILNKFDNKDSYRSVARKPPPSGRGRIASKEKTIRLGGRRPPRP